MNLNKFITSEQTVSFSSIIVYYSGFITTPNNYNLVEYKKTWIYIYVELEGELICI